jgi:hypothetical protein
MANVLEMLFMPNTTAAREGLAISERQRMQQAANQVAAGTARSNVNPLAAARVNAAVTMNERAQMAQQRQAVEAQARQRDIQGGLNLASGLLGNVIGGPAGGAVGSALGDAAGKAIGGAMGGGAPTGGSSPINPGILASFVPGLGGASQTAGLLPSFMGGQTPGKVQMEPQVVPQAPVQANVPQTVAQPQAAQAAPQQPMRQMTMDPVPMQSGVPQQPQMTQVSLDPVQMQGGMPSMPQQAATPPPQPNPASQTLSERNRQQFLYNRTAGLGNMTPYSSLRMLMGM